MLSLAKSISALRDASRPSSSSSHPPSPSPSAPSTSVVASSSNSRSSPSRMSPSSAGPSTPTAGPSTPVLPGSAASSLRGVPSSPNRHRASSSTSASTLTAMSLPPHRLRTSSSGGLLDAARVDEGGGGRQRAKSMAPLGEEGKSEPEIQLLAISSQITEVCYSISDIQTRIFEIQELRHASAFSASSSSPGKNGLGGDGAEGEKGIDQALMALDERLESVSASVRGIDEALEGLLGGGGAEQTPTQTNAFQPLPGLGGRGLNQGETDLVMRKVEDMRAQWEDVSAASEELKEELREDKWLAVFRTVSAQADDMMGSLEKAVTMCHDFIWQAGKMEDHSGSSPGNSFLLSPTRTSVNLERFRVVLTSYESKKKYYVPATTKVISVIDKGMRDRATKNGECLRRHAELRLRWRNLRERMGRIDSEMEGVRLMLTHREDQLVLGASASVAPSQAGDSDEEGSLVSRVTAKSKLSTSMLSSVSATSGATNATGGKARRQSTLSRISAKLGFGVSPSAKSPGSPASTEGSPTANVRKRASYFSLRSSLAGTPEPQRTRPRLITVPLGRSTPLPPAAGGSAAGSSSGGPRWNSSTKVEYVDIKPDSSVAAAAAAAKETPTKGRVVISNPIPIFPQATPTPTPTAGRRMSSMSAGSVRPPSRSSLASTTPSRGMASPTPSRYSLGPPGSLRPTASRVVSGPASTSISTTTSTNAAPPVPPLPSSLGPPTTPTRRRSSTPTGHSKKRSASSSRAGSPPPVPPLPAGVINRSVTPAGLQGTPRPRPSSPSHIPVPANGNSRATTPVSVLHFFGGMDDPDEPPTSLMQRALSPTFSTVSSSGGGELRKSKQRRESHSKIPIPTFQVSSEPPSPPESNGRPSLSPTSATSSVIRPQTPESTLKARASQMPFYQTPTHTPASASKRLSTPASSTRPLLKAPPSSFRESTASPSGRGTPSRPSSRASTTASALGDRTLFSPSLDENPVPQYHPAGPNDPLDSEVAKTVNGLAHGFLIERVDPIGIAPGSSGEHKARYAVSNSLGKKVIVCRLVIMTRSTGGGGPRREIRKVMVRVGGGWQDLDIYLLNRQAGVI